MYRSSCAVVHSIGRPASARGAPTGALRAAFRFGLWATPHSERCLLPHGMAGVHGCSKTLASTYDGRVGLRLHAVHGWSATELPAGTLPPPSLSAPTQLFSTSTGTSDTAAKPAKGGKRGAAVAPSAVLVKVGDGGKDLPFFTDGLMGKNISELLEALASSKVFGGYFSGVSVIGDCSVSVFKVPAGTDEPTAADEAGASELKGAKTVGITADAKAAGIKARGITKNNQICIRVRLPGTTRATPADAAAAAVLTLEAFNNVLSAPATSSVLEAHEAAVNIFTDSNQAWPERLAALNEISTALLEHAPSALCKDISLPLLDTESHLALLAALVQQAEQLEANNYWGLNGVACRLLLGARGIGKTNLILAFIYACSKAFSDVIPLYVTCAGLTADSSFKKMGLKGMMIAAARAHGVNVDESKGAFALTEALQNAAGKRGKRMLIAVDEIDQLYCIDTSEPGLRQNALDSLRYLQELGNQKSGRYAVLLCGSSASTYSLIRKDVNEHLLRRFPLLQTAPDLNSTKFEPLYIPAALCTATEQVERILTALRCLPEGENHEELPPTLGGGGDVPAVLPRKRLQLARLLTFFVGSTPRAIALALQPAKRGVLPAERLQKLVMTRLVASLPSSTVETHAREFFVELLRLLQNANSELRSLLRSKDGTANFTAVMLESWEETVTPLKWEQVQHAWSELAKSKKLPDSNSASYVTTLVNTLSDAGLVSLRLDPGTSGYRLWPASAAQLVYSCENTLTVEVLEAAALKLQPLVRAARDIEPLSKFVPRHAF